MLFRSYGKYEDSEAPSKLPELKEGSVLPKKDATKEQHFTKAPARYNEGKVVKLMQENDIGRPSTYSPTITTLLGRDYIENQKGSLVPTDQGILTADELEKHFPKYMDVSYTAQMENNLDSIADGKTDKVKLLKDFWDEFQTFFNEADEKMEKIAPKEVGRNCPKCGAPLVMRHGKFGDFVGCSNYPKCNYIEKPKPDVIEGKTCPKCGAPLVKRHGRKGDFIGCSNYPKCNYMESLDGKEISTEKKPLVIPDDAPICPKCHVGHLIEKKSRWGKTFIGCSNYPKCHYIQPEPGAKKPSKKTKKK